MRIKVNRTELQRRALEHGYSLAELQRKANLSPYTLYNIMNKNVSARPATIKKLADALDCDIMELANVEEPTNETKGA